jgi:uncharacterized protein
VIVYGAAGGWRGKRRLNRSLPTLAFLLFIVSTIASATATDADAWVRAINRRDVIALQQLAERDVDVNRTGDSGRTALMVAASEGRRSLVASLLDRGARIDVANDRGGTALMHAATRGDSETLDLLLARGAAINARASNGWTALMLAGARGFEPIVERLLAHGADPNIADIYGWTPLMRAVDLGRPAIVKTLLADSRVDVDARDENGQTALHHAARQGYVDIARMLIGRAAKRDVRDRAGRTAADLAIAEGHREIAQTIARGKRALR